MSLSQPGRKRCRLIPHRLWLHRLWKSHWSTQTLSACGCMSRPPHRLRCSSAASTFRAGKPRSTACPSTYGRPRTRAPQRQRAGGRTHARFALAGDSGPERRKCAHPGDTGWADTFPSPAGRTSPLAGAGAPRLVGDGAIAQFASDILAGLPAAPRPHPDRTGELLGFSAEQVSDRYLHLTPYWQVKAPSADLRVRWLLTDPAGAVVGGRAPNLSTPVLRRRAGRPTRSWMTPTGLRCPPVCQPAPMDWPRDRWASLP